MLLSRKFFVRFSWIMASESHKMNKKKKQNGNSAIISCSTISQFFEAHYSISMVSYVIHFTKWWLNVLAYNHVCVLRFIFGLHLHGNQYWYISARVSCVSFHKFFGGKVVQHHQQRQQHSTRERTRGRRKKRRGRWTVCLRKWWRLYRQRNRTKSVWINEANSYLNKIYPSCITSQRTPQLWNFFLRISLYDSQRIRFQNAPIHLHIFTLAKKNRSRQ